MTPLLFEVARDHELARQLLDVSDPDAGRLVITATPGMKGINPMTRAALDALAGPHLGAGIHDHKYGLGWGMVPIKLAARGITDLAVLEAQMLHPKAAEELALGCAAAGTQLWLVAHPPRKPVVDRLVDAWGEPTTDTRALRRRFLFGASIREPEPPQDPTFPHVPRVAFWCFRTRCRERLGPEEFAAVDELFVRTHLATTAWVADAPRRYRMGVVAETVVRHLLFRLVQEWGVTIDAAITVVHAAAAALLPHEILVRTDLDRLSGSLSRAPWWLSYRNPDLAALHGYAHPVRGAAVAAVAAGCPPEHVSGLTVGDVAATGGYLKVQGKHHPVSPIVRPHLVAQRLYRLADGAGPDDPFLVSLRSGVPLTTSRVRALVTAAAVDHGVVVDGRRSHPHPADSPVTLLKRCGVEVLAL